MNQAQATQTVLGVIIVSALVIGYDSFKKSGKANPGFKSLGPMFLLAGGLLLAAEAAPQIAGPFALLIGLAVVLSRLPQGAKK